MIHVRSLVSLVVAVAAIGVVWWARLPVLAVFLALVCGLGGLLYLVAGPRGAGDGRSSQEREGNERFLRDIPPPS